MEMVKQDNRRELSAKVTTKDGFHLLLFVEFVVILHVESEVCKNIITSLVANLSVRMFFLFN
jgi:hypothetical protein